jgi:hypothetical protein
MSVVTAPVDELMSFVDEIQGWLNVNRILDETVGRALRGITDLADWVGPAAEAFGTMAMQQIKQRLAVVLAVIDVFLGALNAIIDVIQTLLEIAMAPVAAVESLLDAIF